MGPLNPNSSEKRLRDTGLDSISLQSLSELTGFPQEFIKGELMVQKDSLSLAELRESMLFYLNSAFDGDEQR